MSYSEIISEIQIVNLLGQQVLIRNLNSNEAEIDMQFLPSGTYLVKVSSDNKVKTIKVLKQ